MRSRKHHFRVLHDWFNSGRTLCARTLIAVCLISLPIHITFAEEEKTEGGEKKAEGGGEVEKPETKAYRTSEARLVRLRTSIDKTRAEMNELIDAKGKVEDQAQAVVITKQISDKLTELKGYYKEYREISLNMRFKHPEKGNFSDRKYLREEEGPDASAEFDLGIQGKLDKTKAKAEVLYQIEHPKPPEPPPAPEPEKRDPAAEKESGRITLSK